MYHAIIILWSIILQGSDTVTMKDNRYKKYIGYGVTAFLVIAASIFFFFFLFKLDSIRGFFSFLARILEPFFLGAVIAYLVAPFYNLLHRNLYDFFSRKMKPRRAGQLSVGISLFISIVAVLLVIFSLFAMIVPQFVNSIINIFNSLETYSINLQHWIGGMLEGNPELAAKVDATLIKYYEVLMTWLDSKMTPDLEALFTSISGLGDLFSGIVSRVFTVVRVAKDFLIGVIASAYLLVAKRHLIAQAKKITYGLFPLKTANYIIYEGRYIHTVFGGFIRGKLLDSLIIGILCFIGCTLFKFPYALVISVIVGVTNIIPFFGPFVGAIPSALLILMVDPIKCIYFILFVVVLQQFDGNVLGPKILGNTTGLSSFWVLFSIILFGGLFGFVGMIIGVPVFAVIYSLISNTINHLLKKKTLSLETNDYELLDHVDESNSDFIHLKDPTLK